MKITVHSVHFDADKKLIEFIENKINKVGTKYDDLISGEVFLRIDNSSNNENKVAEVRLTAPGKEMFAKKQCKTFEEATDNAVEAIRKQIAKHKEKLKTT
jgi:putative sigma-54 modulation protein